MIFILYYSHGVVVLSKGDKNTADPIRVHAFDPFSLAQSRAALAIMLR